MREVVKINNEQEWEYVKEKINNPKGLLDFRWYFADNICINVRNGNYDYVDYYKREGYIIISFDEFKSRYEPQLKIGDTFEKDGFVCRVESEVKKWYKSENAYVRTEPMKAEGWTEITNKEFIKQLEDNAR